MSDGKDRELSDLFANETPVDDARFVNRVSSRLQRRRRLVIALRVALLVAAVVTVAPFVPSFIASLLKTVGL